MPGGHWERLTVIGALGLEGVVASMSIAAATSTAVFLAFVEQVLLPALRGRPDAIVVMDNLGAHKAERVREAFEAAKVTYRYLPSYSPDLNPIEPCWSKLKGGLRAKAARTLEALEAELGPVVDEPMSESPASHAWPMAFLADEHGVAFACSCASLLDGSAEARQVNLTATRARACRPRIMPTALVPPRPIRATLRPASPTRLCYLIGEGVERDPRPPLVPPSRPAGPRGRPMRATGLLYETGDEVPCDVRRPLHRYQPAATAGNAGLDRAACDRSRTAQPSAWADRAVGRAGREIPRGQRCCMVISAGCG